MRHRITSFRCVIADVQIGMIAAKIKSCIARQFRQSSMLRAASGEAGRTSRTPPPSTMNRPRLNAIASSTASLFATTPAAGQRAHAKVGGDRHRRRRRRDRRPEPPQRHPPREPVAADRKGRPEPRLAAAQHGDIAPLPGRQRRRPRRIEHGRRVLRGERRRQRQHHPADRASSELVDLGLQGGELGLELGDLARRVAVAGLARLAPRSSA